MKKEAFPRIAALVIAAFALILSMNSDGMSGQVQPELRQSVEQKFEQYRAALKEEHQIDIKNFKDRIPGGVADGKPITNYDLKQLLLGIKWERAHTNKDNMLARIRRHMALVPESMRFPRFILYTDHARYGPEHPESLIFEPIWQTAHSDEPVALLKRG